MTSREMELTDEGCHLCKIHASAGRSMLSADHKCADHMHYHAAAMSSSAATAYKASLELIFAHVADIHTLMLKIIAEKYGHSVEDMIETVRENEEWKSIYLHPTLKTLTYFPIPESPLPGTKMIVKRKTKK